MLPHKLTSVARKCGFNNVPNCCEAKSCSCSPAPKSYQPKSLDFSSTPNRYPSKSADLTAGPKCYPPNPCSSCASARPNENPLEPFKSCAPSIYLYNECPKYTPLVCKPKSKCSCKCKSQAKPKPKPAVENTSTQTNVIEGVSEQTQFPEEVRVELIKKDIQEFVITKPSGETETIIKATKSIARFENENASGVEELKVAEFDQDNIANIEDFKVDTAKRKDYSLTTQQSLTTFVNDGNEEVQVSKTSKRYDQYGQELDRTTTYTPASPSQSRRPSGSGVSDRSAIVRNANARLAAGFPTEAPTHKAQKSTMKKFRVAESPEPMTNRRASKVNKTLHPTESSFSLGSTNRMAVLKLRKENRIQQDHINFSKLPEITERTPSENSLTIDRQEAFVSKVESAEGEFTRKSIQMQRELLDVPNAEHAAVVFDAQSPRRDSDSSKRSSNNYDSDVSSQGRNTNDADNFKRNSDPKSPRRDLESDTESSGKAQTPKATDYARRDAESIASNPNDLATDKMNSNRNSESANPPARTDESQPNAETANAKDSENPNCTCRRSDSKNNGSTDSVKSSDLEECNCDNNADSNPYTMQFELTCCPLNSNKEMVCVPMQENCPKMDVRNVDQNNFMYCRRSCCTRQCNCNFNSRNCAPRSYPMYFMCGRNACQPCYPRK